MGRGQFLLGLSAIGASGLTIAGARYWPESGFTNPCFSHLPDELKQHPLMQTIWGDIDAAQVWDTHAHIIGVGDNGGDVWCNPDMDNWSHLILKIQKDFHMNGGCITSGREDETFIASMVGLSANMPAQNHAICV